MEKRQAARRKYHFIYKTTCLVTGKEYYGMHSTDDLDDGYLGSGIVLRRSIRKHGKENHIREIFGDFLPDRESLRLREAEIIDEHRLRDQNCMNLAKGGMSSRKIRNSIHGWKLSDETKKKLSEVHKGQIPWMKGRTHSDEVRRKLSKLNTGRIHSDESKKKISNAQLGKVHSNEWTTKINEANRGGKRSEESKQKMRDAWKKRLVRGKKHSEETRAVLSQKAKIREERKRQLKSAGVLGCGET